MKMSKKEYDKYVKSLAPKSPMGKNVLWAFLMGGGICLLGQVLRTGWEAAGLEEEAAGTMTSVSLIFLSAVFTGLSLYDDLARHAGAGTLVPITGFANAMVSPAMDFRAETITLGTCTKMFTIAGPVIVFGVVSSVIYGIIYWIVSLF